MARETGEAAVQVTSRSKETDIIQTQDERFEREFREAERGCGAFGSAQLYGVVSRRLEQMDKRARAANRRADAAEAEVARLKAEVEMLAREREEALTERNSAQAYADECDRDCTDMRYQRDAAEARAEAAERQTRQALDVGQELHRTLAEAISSAEYNHEERKQADAWSAVADLMRDGLMASFRIELEEISAALSTQPHAGPASAETKAPIPDDPLHDLFASEDAPPSAAAWPAVRQQRDDLLKLLTKLMEAGLPGDLPSLDAAADWVVERMRWAEALSDGAEGEASFGLGVRVRKIRGSEWQGPIVGSYSTKLTERGWCVESERHHGSVQIYPEAALEIVSAEREAGDST